MRKRLLDEFDCIECGYVFDINDASRMGTTVWCPMCGRANGIDWYTLEGFQIESLNEQDYTDDEPYLKGCFSGDLEETNNVHRTIAEGSIKNGKPSNTWTLERKRSGRRKSEKDDEEKD